MTPHLVVRVDGDTFAVTHRGDLRDSVSRAMDTAMPDPGSTVHVAIVIASDAGAARLTRVAYWTGPADVDADFVRYAAAACGFDPDAFDVDGTIALASALVDELAAWSGPTDPEIYSDDSDAAHVARGPR